MKFKRITIISSVCLIILSIIAGIAVYKYVGPGSEDIKSCRSFLENLNSAGALDAAENIKFTKYIRNNKNSNKDDLVEKSIITQLYGFDLDKNNNVIGFVRKNPGKQNVEKVSSSKAEELSLKYLKSIYNASVILKSIEENDGENYLSYYSFIYCREKNGYASYFDEIKLNINKENGLLEGYSNSALQKECRKSTIKITQDKAEKYAMDYFLESNKYGAVEKSNSNNLYYADNNLSKQTDNQCWLCYLITINGKDVKDKDVRWKIFVSVEDGRIVNRTKEQSEEKVKTY